MWGRVTSAVLAVLFFAIWIWSLIKGNVFEMVGCLACYNMYLEMAVKEWRK